MSACPPFRYEPCPVAFSHVPPPRARDPGRERSPLTNNRVPSAAVVEELESKLKLPSGASPLSAYTRFYAEVDISGRDAIVGQLIDSRVIATNASIKKRPAPPAVNRVLEADLTPMFDGGCMAVNVMYDVQAKSTPTAVCNPPGPGGR